MRKVRAASSRPPLMRLKGAPNPRASAGRPNARASATGHRAVRGTAAAIAGDQVEATEAAGDRSVEEGAEDPAARGDPPAGEAPAAGEARETEEASVVGEARAGAEAQAGRCPTVPALPSAQDLSVNRPAEL